MSSISWRRVRRFALLLSLPCALAQAQARDAWVELSGRDAAASAGVATQVRVFDVDTARIASALPRSAQATIDLPLARGGFATFTIEDSGTMHPDLAAQFPEIHTLRGRDADGRRLRLDVSPAGIHAMIFGDDGVQVIRPRSIGDSVHESFARADYTGPREPFRCDVPHASPLEKALHEIDGHTHDDTAAASKTVTGDVRRTFRLAVAATGEYTAFHGGTVALGLAAITATVNRVNEVYGVDVAVHLQLIANNSLLVYTNSSSDPYTNGNPNTMINQNVTNVNTVIGAANYDVGHVFGTNSGGLAGLGVLCSAGNKAAGVTGNGSPVGDPFDIDYVAHEIGHQFGGNHTFNGNASSCAGGNRNGGTAYEPGSGSTIMAYAGICAAQNLQPNSDPYFHAISLQEIQAHIASRTCDVETATGNTAPTLDTPAPRTIPARTPFVLRASGSDTDGDVLDYAWEQFDTGSTQTTTAPSPTSTTMPLLRSFNPTPDPERIVPRLSSLLSNTSTNGEVLPTVSRAMKFRITARDGAPDGGATRSADVTYTVVDTGTAFAVTAPNTAVAWTCGQDANVTWNVAGTTAAGINCADVDIALSQDGGFTFDHTLASGVPNNGAATVPVPFVLGTQARVRVMCADNVFFDIGDANFSVIDGGEPSPQADVLAGSLEDTERSIAIGDLSGNDTLGAGPAELASVGNASGGTVALVGGAAVFTPAADATGTASFEYTLVDSCARPAPANTPALASFELQAVNDAPTLAPLADVVVATQPLSGSVVGFASVASFGPADEAGQGVADYTVTLVSDPDGVIDSIGIDANGDLQYTLTGVAGDVQLSAVVRDDGGVADGGVDTSAAVTFALQAKSDVDVRVSKSDGRTTALIGQVLTYTLTMGNAGTSPVSAAQLVDNLPAALLDASWTCSAVGTDCPTAAGVGDIDLTVALPVGASISITLTATLAGEVGDVVSNTVSATVLSPLEVEQSPEDNSATDETRIVVAEIFADGYESAAD